MNTEKFKHVCHLSKTELDIAIKNELNLVRQRIRDAERIVNEEVNRSVLGIESFMEMKTS